MILITGATGLLGSNLLIELTQFHSKIRASYRNKLKIVQVEKLFQFYFKSQSNEFFAKIEWVKMAIAR
jgi:uncharacterized protein YbjT (DUF2867 family)